MSKTEITYQGKQAWKHSDGSIRDSKGRIQAGGKPDGALANFDSETGRQVAEDRWEQRRQDVEAGMVAGTEGASSVGEAVVGMATVQAQVASKLDRIDPAPSRLAFESLMKHSGSVPGPRKQAGSQPGLQLSMDAGAVEALAGLLSRLPAGEIVEGSFTEAGPAEAGGLAGGRVLPGEDGEDTETI